MKARLLLAAVAFVALSSIAVAQEQTKKAGCCSEKQKTECTKSKDASKSSEKKADTAKKVEKAKK